MVVKLTAGGEVYMGLWDIVAFVVDPVGSLTQHAVKELAKHAGAKKIPATSLGGVISTYGNDADDVLAAVAAAAVAPVTVAAVAAYIASLEAQAAGRYKSIPEPLRGLLRPHYSANLDHVRYADGINTLFDNQFTFGNHIFFNKPIDFTRRNNVNVLAHELTHVDHYRAAGGPTQFLLRYIFNSGLVLANGSFNMHADNRLEREATDKAGRVTEAVFAAMGTARLHIIGRQRFMSQASNLALDARSPDTRLDGCQVQLWQDQQGLNQEWVPVAASDGYYKFMNMHSGLLLDADPAKVTQNGCPVRLWRDTGAHNQHWKFENVRAAISRVRCRQGGLVLDCDSGRVQENGCRVQLWQQLNTDNQHWHL
jgi:hypothetical protein